MSGEGGIFETLAPRPEAVQYGGRTDDRGGRGKLFETDIMKITWLTVVGAGWLLVAGCASAPPPDSVLIQGSWAGQEVRNGRSFQSSLSLVGRDWEFHGADLNDWSKGTYTLREDTTPKQLTVVITQSPRSQEIGETIHAIFQVRPGPQTDQQPDQGTLILTANAPGNPQPPAGFGDRQARQIVFVKD